MQDFLGQELHIGSVVAFVHRSNSDSHRLASGVVVKLNKSMLQVEMVGSHWVKDKDTGKSKLHPIRQHTHTYPTKCVTVPGSAEEHWRKYGLEDAPLDTVASLDLGVS